MIVPFELSHEKQHPCTRITAFSPTFSMRSKTERSCYFRGKNCYKLHLVYLFYLSEECNDQKTKHLLSYFDRGVWTEYLIHPLSTSVLYVDPISNSNLHRVYQLDNIWPLDNCVCNHHESDQ